MLASGTDQRNESASIRAELDPYLAQSVCGVRESGELDPGTKVIVSYGSRTIVGAYQERLWFLSVEVFRFSMGPGPSIVPRGSAPVKVVRSNRWHTPGSPERPNRW